jgi:hypothetical protein
MITNDDKLWTRLIDGELSFAEQRTALAALDDTPDGWKRLALGLLEAEAFRRELRSCVPVETAIVSPLPARQRAPRRPVQSLMVAAACLVCLSLGMGLERFGEPAAPIVDETAAVTPTFAPDDAQTQQTLKLVFADWPAGGQSVEVPVVEAADVDATEMLQRSAVPDAIRKKLEAQGYVIHEERKFVPVSLANGRQGIAPVSDVVVKYQPVVYQ